MRKTSRGTSPTCTKAVTTHDWKRTSRRPRAAAAAFRERYYGKVAEPDAGGARRGDRRARAHRGGADARRLLRAPPLRDRHGRPAARRARRPHHGEGRRARHAAPLLRARDRGARGRRRRGAPRGAGARALAALAPLAAQVPAVPPLRARGEDRHREDASPASAPGAGCTRSSSARSGSSSTATETSFEEAMSKLYSADRDVRRSAAEAVTEALEPGLRTRTFVFNTILARQVDRRPPARLPDVDLGPQPAERHDGRGRAGADRRGRRPATTSSQRYYTLKAKLVGLDRLTYYDRFAPIGEDPSKVVVGRGARHRRRRVRGLRAGGRRRRRALLRRELDRRPGAREQAHGRVLRDDRPGRAPVRPHELHGRPPLDPHARARARPRPARLRWRSRSGSSTRTRR